MYKYRFSVFTATYNRAIYLPEVYECLKKQTFKDFEWVIVDDGSSDNTEEVCNAFIKEGLMPIKYIKKVNGGKHTAWREATKVFEGQYELGADDDDIFPDNTLEIFDHHWKTLEARPDYNNFWEIRACVQLENGKINTPSLPSNPFDSDYIAVNYGLGFGGAEMQGCRKIKVLRNEAAVPEHFIFDECCSNFPEAIRWIRAARKYKTRFVRDVVRIYVHRDGVSLCSSNKGKNRSIRRTYNSVVSEIFALNEQRDLFFKYKITGYFKTIFLLAYHQVCLKKILMNPLLHVIDKIMVCSVLPMASIVYFLREK